MRRILFVFATLLVACGRGPVDRGAVVSEGVARLTFEVRANGTDLIPVTVLFPADSEGRPSSRNNPAVLYIQGGAVSPSRYEWQGVELAKRGFVVAYPRHQLDLAFFAIDNAQAARRALLNGEAGSALEGLVDASRVAVAGHSLGGVVAMKLALQGGFQAAVVQASFQDTADNAKVPGLTIPTLYLAGQGDCQAKEAQVREGWATVPSPSALVVLEQVTHYQFTNSQAEDEKKGCAVALDLAVAHERVIQATAAFLSAALASPPSVGESALRAVPSSVVEVR
ncbi:MAG: hypothetical protein GQE15_40410 [Archangiaceae bacterium]|nr:hypothetical protein [Archangiaceae bacterium]